MRGLMNFLKKHPKVWIPFVLIAVVLACYAMIITSPFLWDDEVMVVGNPLIRSIDNIKLIFTSAAFGDRYDPGNFYRPLQILSYVFDYEIWGLNPLGFHITNIALHILSTLLLFYLLLQWRIGIWASFAIALLFGVHPVNVESVTYISGRGDALYMFLSLLSFLLFSHGAIHRKKIVPFLLSIFLFGLAILSKENAIMTPFILGLFLVINPLKIKWNFWTWAWSVIMMLSAVAYTAFRLVPMRLATPNTYSLIAHASFLERLWTLPQVLVTYLQLMVWPINLHMEYHFVQYTFNNPYLVIGMPLLILTCGLLIWMVQPRRWTLFFIMWFFLGLAPAYHFPHGLASSVREHWLYLSQIGFLGLLCLTALYVTQRMSALYQRILLSGLLIGLCVFFMGCTLFRNYDWREPLRLYEHDSEYSPNSFLLFNNIGVEYYRRNDKKKAKEAFQRAIYAGPGYGYGTAYNNLGVILEEEGDKETARSHFLFSIEVSHYELAYANLGRIYLQLHNYEEAQRVLEEGLQRHPTHEQITYFLMLAYQMNGQLEKAQELERYRTRLFGQ